MIDNRLIGFLIMYLQPTELFEGRSTEKILILKMDANKVEVNECFIAESLRYECLWDVTARAYKDCSARKMLCELIEIIRSYST